MSLEIELELPTRERLIESASDTDTFRRVWHSWDSLYRDISHSTHIHDGIWSVSTGISRAENREGVGEILSIDPVQSSILVTTSRVHLRSGWEVYLRLRTVERHEVRSTISDKSYISIWTISGFSIPTERLRIRKDLDEVVELPIVLEEFVDLRLLTRPVYIDFFPMDTISIPTCFLLRETRCMRNTGNEKEDEKKKFFHENYYFGPEVNLNIFIFTPHTIAATKAFQSVHNLENCFCIVVRRSGSGASACIENIQSQDFFKIYTHVSLVEWTPICPSLSNSLNLCFQM